jgi:hypothetical protein
MALRSNVVVVILEANFAAEYFSKISFSAISLIFLKVAWLFWQMATPRIEKLK